MPKTICDTFHALKEKVYSDPVLQARLFDCVDEEGFWLTLREAASELGLELGEDRLRAALREGGRGWHGRLLG